MKTRRRILMRGIPLIFFAFALISCFSDVHARRLSSDQLCIEKTCFNVEFAMTLQERMRGLMFRNSMKASEGMLLVFEESDQHSIWMKNVKFSLDLLWVDENRTIQSIEKEVPPCLEMPCPQYNPGVDSLYVLELLGGSTDRYHFQIGQKLHWT